MALELPHKALVVQIPHCYVPVRTTTETDFGVWTDGQGVACGSARCQLRFDSWCRACQVPDGEVAGLAAHYEGSTVGQEFNRPDIVVSLLENNN